MPLTIREPITKAFIDDGQKVVIVESVNKIVTIEQGPPGIKGDTGDSGEAILFHQDTPSDTWVIIHNLGRRIAAITVYDSAETIIHGEVVFNSLNQVTVLFSNPFSGKAEIV